MTKSNITGRSVPSSEAAGSKTRVVREETAAGRVLWHVTTESGRATFIATPSSTAAMNDAMDIYAGALKRLAKR